MVSTHGPLPPPARCVWTVAYRLAVRDDDAIVAVSKIFTKDRLYIGAIVVVALVALGIFIAKVVAEGKHDDQLRALQDQRDEQIAALRTEQNETIVAVEERYLGIIATALTGLPEPVAETGPDAFYPTLDALARNHDVELVVIVTGDGQVLASSNRHLEGKPASEVLPKAWKGTGGGGVMRTDEGWLVVAPVGAESPGTVVLRLASAAGASTAEDSAPRRPE